MWQPALIELHNNRLMPLASRDYRFEYQLPKDSTGLKLITKGRYHIQTERQHQMLMNKYGLTTNDPYHFTVYERTAPLTSNLPEAFGRTNLAGGHSCVLSSRSLSDLYNAIVTDPAPIMLHTGA